MGEKSLSNSSEVYSALRVEFRSKKFKEYSVNFLKWNLTSNEWKVTAFLLKVLVKVLPLEMAGVNVSFNLRVDSESVRANVLVDYRVEMFLRAHQTHSSIWSEDIHLTIQSEEFTLYEREISQIRTKCNIRK